MDKRIRESRRAAGEHMEDADFRVPGDRRRFVDGSGGRWSIVIGTVVLVLIVLALSGVFKGAPLPLPHP